jgi:hypothetical protein
MSVFFKTIVLSFLLIFPVSNLQASENIGFSSGDTFTAHEYDGSFTLFCPGQSITVNCQAYGLSPQEFDHLVFPASINADEVKLTRTNVRGDQRSKTSNIRSGQNRSKKSFNLWIRTLFQRPLLSMGRNTLAYEFSLNNNVTEEGEFQVIVNNGGLKTCRHGVLNGTARDCEAPTTLCDTYFRNQNYCQ